MAARLCSVDECGRQVVGRGLCNVHYRRLRRNGTVELPDKGPCAGCGTELVRPPRGKLPEMCGECRKVDRLERFFPATTRRPRGAVACVVCETPIVAARFCSDNCRSTFHRFGPDGRPAARICSRCGDPVDLTERLEDGRLRSARTTLHPECRRKTRYYGMTVAEIVERDGTACGICGDAVDLALKAPHNESPSIDHIIPWSLGGRNEPFNLQLAHRICNVYKGSRAYTSPDDVRRRNNPTPAAAGHRKETAQ